MRKLVLIPESKYLQLTEEVQTKNNGPSILQGIRHPERQEMLKKYNLTQSILNDPEKSSEIKISEYGDAFNDFSVLRDRIKGERVPAQRVDAKPADVATSAPTSRKSQKVKKKSIPSRPPGIPQTRKREEVVVSTGDESDDDEDRSELMLTPQQLATIKRRRRVETKKSSIRTSTRKPRAKVAIAWDNRR